MYTAVYTVYLYFRSATVEMITSSLDLIAGENRPQSAFQPPAPANKLDKPHAISDTTENILETLQRIEVILYNQHQVNLIIHSKSHYILLVSPVSDDD